MNFGFSEKNSFAERYLADADYEPGTVVIYGGQHEITISKRSHDTALAGVISSVTSSEKRRPHVTLAGRSICKVVGPIRKGDLLTTSEIPGHAKRICSAVLGTIIGKALEDFVGEKGEIEISVQRS